MKPCLNGYIFLIIDFNPYTEIFPQWKFFVANISFSKEFN